MSARPVEGKRIERVPRVVLVERECVVIEDTRYGRTFHFFPCCQTKAAEGRQIQEWLGVVEECGGSVVQGPPRKQ